MKFTKIEIIQRVNFDKHFRRKLMKRFLWLAAALAAMVLVGCSNNAGGVVGDSPKEGAVQTGGLEHGRAKTLRKES